jgi:DNA-binding transcriptional MocR family regulator
METQALVHGLGAWSAGKGSLQQKLARALAQTIRNGAINPGMRLPSERTMAQALTLSRTTVIAAYDALRETGWLESRPGSGTWVSARSRAVAAARGAAHTGALAASPLLGLLAQHEGDGMIDFALGAPLPLMELPVELFTIPADEYASLVRDPRYHPLGVPTLRQAIAEYYSNAGLDTRPAQVLVTSGAQQAIALCAALYLQRGDSVLAEDPTYFGALDACRAAGARVAGLPVHASGVPPAILHDRITAGAPRLVYLTPSFQNPTGAVMPAQARSEVCRIAREFGVPIIEDSTFADLALDGSLPPPLAAYAGDAPVITIGSLSKLLWPGLRVGWIRAAEPVVERLARVKSAFDLGSPLIPQAIAVRLLGSIDEARRLRRNQLKPRRDLLAGLLRKHLPTWKFRVPGGGLFLWVKLPEGDARELAQAALRHGVVILPGPAMSPTGGHTDFLRLPFLAEPATLRMGLGRLSAAWRDYQSTDRRERQQSVALV